MLCYRPVKRKLLKGEKGDQMGAMPESVLPSAELLIYRLPGNVQGLYWECGFHGSAWKADWFGKLPLKKTQQNNHRPTEPSTPTGSVRWHPGFFPHDVL